MRIDSLDHTLFHSAMVRARRSSAYGERNRSRQLFLLLFYGGIMLMAAAAVSAEPRPLPELRPLPRSLDPDFEFRKFKIYNLTDQVTKTQTQKNNASGSETELNSRRNLKSKNTAQEASLNFERSYRLFGAVTAYDQRQRQGQYFDFFWRARRRADVTVRFEYKQQNLRALVQAQELGYHDVEGTVHSAFRVVGDEYHDDGEVLAWRCLLIEQGRIVAEKRSFLWQKAK